MRFVALAFAALVALATPAGALSSCCGHMPEMVLSGTPVLNATINTAIVPWTITTTYGARPITYSILSGVFPNGVTLSAAGVVSGTPTQAGNFANIVIGATDSSQPGAHRSAQLPPFSMMVTSPGNGFAFSASPAPTTTGVVGTPVTPFTVTASGGSAPYSYAVVSGVLPIGVTLNPSTGVVSGTPTEDGTYTRIVIRATDNIGGIANLASFDWAIQAALPAVVIGLTGTDPLRYMRPGLSPSGTIWTAAGITIDQRQSKDSLPADLDPDGNYTGSIWYGVDWPPGNLIPPSPAPFVNSEITNYPFRASTGQTNNPTLRNLRVLGTVSSYADYPLLNLIDTDTQLGQGIVFPGSAAGCYANYRTMGPTANNVTVSGAAGSFNLQTVGQTNSSILFVGEAVTNQIGPGPGLPQVGLGEGAVISQITGANSLILSVANAAAVTKGTFHGCTSTYQNSAGILFDFIGSGIGKVIRVRIDHVHDGIRIFGSVPGTSAGRIEEAWISFCRDDCIEDDRMQTVYIKDSYFADAYMGISADQPTVLPNQMVTLDGVIMHHRSFIDSYNNRTPPYYVYGVPFKWVNNAPDITLKQTIIAIDGAYPNRASRWVSAWAKMTNGVGNCVDNTTNPITGLQGNYFLWTSDDPLPGVDFLGTIPTSCFPSGHIQTGATARATLAAATLAWKNAHPWLYRLPSD